jgi:tetratricopeptide (TPR) repeat protein
METSWLHVSDLGFRGGGSYDRDAVLGALVDFVKWFRDERGRRPDLVFATGDVAHAGQANEYEAATKFFDDLIAAAGVERRRLFVVPGNHDVDRKKGIGLARTFLSRDEADEYFDPRIPKTHITFKQHAFVQWYNRYFEGIRTFPDNSTCGPLEVIDIPGVKIGVLPMNSALFCQGDDDYDKLWIGRRCLSPAMEKLKELGTNFNIALIHHPLDWLSSIERGNIKDSLQSSVHFILRGHLKRPDVESVAGFNGEALYLGAGATYQAGPKRAIYATIDGDRVTVFPIRFESQPREVWTVNPSLFPRELNYEKSFAIPRLTAQATRASAMSVEKPLEQAPLPTFRSNISSRGNRPFVGREALLSVIQQRLDDPSQDAVLVIRGPAGVGKSELAQEFARRHRKRYPGGAFFVDASTGGAPVDLASIGETVLGLDFPPDFPIQDQCIRTLLALANAPSILIYDNVRSPDSIIPWLPRAGMPCHVLITSVFDRWDAGWLSLLVEPLPLPESLKLIELLADRDVVERFGDRLAALAGGLPVQLVPAAITLAYEKRRNRLSSAELTMTRETETSFRGIFEQLEAPIQLLLHSAAFLQYQRIPREELALHLANACNWSRAEFERRLDACLDLYLLEGGGELRMHQLFASFVLATPISSETVAMLGKVRIVQGRRLVELASKLAAEPTRADLAGTLMAFPLLPQTWDATEAAISIEEGEAVGLALLEIGQFEEARRWFARAVEAKEKRDGGGRVDQASVGYSLHQVGLCLLEAGKPEEALPWYERAVASRENGDVHGRVDHASLARSLCQVSVCLSRAGQIAAAGRWAKRAVAAAEKGDAEGCVDHACLGESLHMVGFSLSERGKVTAQRWYRRAVKAKNSGDLHGCVDNASIAKSLHQVGFCLARAGQFDAARPWFERAVVAAEKGDAHNRVDHMSLGKSLHEVAFYLSEENEFEAALSWFERAVAAKEKGDVHGRIDHESLGRSLQGMGNCASSLGRLEAALSSFERAVAAKEKGDVYGRIDYESISLSLRAGAARLRQLGRSEEAKGWEEKTAALEVKIAQSFVSISPGEAPT